MTHTTDIRAAQQRVIDVFTRKPSAALSTMTGSARIEAGLACTYRQGERAVTMDMGTPLGGTGEAPTPGFYFRAAVSGCIAIGIKLTAAREGLELETVTVDVEMDFDDSAMLGMGSNPASPLTTRFAIAIESRETAETLRGLVDRALAADPYFLALRDAQSVTVRVS
jgi:uncharacterized OsmC-like protein